MFSCKSSFIAKYGKAAGSYQYSYSDIDDMPGKLASTKSLENLNTGQIRKSDISKESRKKIMKRAFILGTISNEKFEKDKTGKRVQYKLKFITLTISGESIFSVKDANKYLLNTFLQDLRRNLNMTNYIWRMEHQKNGKIHYHIITDANVNYQYVRHVWNRIQIQAGTMQAFTDKFSKMSLSDYVGYMHRNVNSNLSYEDLTKWYTKGVRENWENPNSVDVVRITEEKQLFYYIAKYISKNDDCNDLTGRVWGCSSELTKASDMDYEIQDVLEFAYYKTIEHNHCEEIEMDFCTLVFVKWESLFSWYPFIKSTLRERWADKAGLKPFEPIQGALQLLGGHG